MSESAATSGSSVRRFPRQNPDSERSDMWKEHNVQDRLIGVLIFLAINLPLVYALSWFMEERVLPPRVADYSKTIVAVLFLSMLFFKVFGYILKLQHVIKDDDTRDSAGNVDPQYKDAVNVSYVHLAVSHLGPTLAAYSVICIVTYFIARMVTRS